MDHNTKYATWSTIFLSCCFTHCHVRNCDNPLPWQSTAVVPSDNRLPWQSTAVVPSDRSIPYPDRAQQLFQVPLCLSVYWFVMSAVHFCLVCRQQWWVNSLTSYVLCTSFIFIFLNSHTSKFTYTDICASDLKITKYEETRISFSWN